MRFAAIALLTILLLGLSAPATRAAKPDSSQIRSALNAVDAFRKADKGMEKFFAESYAYAVFPNVGKAAWGVGGAHGNGVVFVGGQPVAATELIQATIGLQFGGQSYREILFFESKDAFASFQQGELKLSGQASAVAVTLGASANLKYNEGIAIATMTKGGLMYEASVGGQHFSYKPYDAGEKQEGPKAAPKESAAADSSDADS